MSEFTKEVPSVGDTVRVRNTDSGDVFAEGEVEDVTRYYPDSDVGAEGDDAVYIEFEKEPDNKVMYKEGYFEGEVYSWLRLSNYGGPEISEGEDCWEYEIV